MELGILTHHLERTTIEEVAAAVAGYGLTSVQLNLESAGLPAFPEAPDKALAKRIVRAFRDRDITIAAVSGTFNMIDPDRDRLQRHVDLYETFLAWCLDLECTVATACSGTRDRTSMWRFHPDNATPEAWQDLMNTLSELLPAAETLGIDIAVEPEVVNVIDSAEQAERLLKECHSPHLKIVMDPANYFHPPMLAHMDAVLDDVFSRVGGHIALAHAKDVRAPDPGGTECVRPAAGTGVLDYPRYMQLLRATGYDGALIMHSLAEREVPTSAAYVRRHLAG
ncbi:MAG TPA: sugar phosphate isomerase/epimerase [Chloroflexota bacterium]|nr:sugar phosphate isomerase/epimerase [Chloroflexota bacterium]